MGSGIEMNSLRQTFQRFFYQFVPLDHDFEIKNHFRNVMPSAHEQTMSWLGFIPARTGLRLVYISVIIDTISSYIMIFFFIGIAFGFRDGLILIALAIPWIFVSYLNTKASYAFINFHNSDTLLTRSKLLKGFDLLLYGFIIQEINLGAFEVWL